MIEQVKGTRNIANDDSAKFLHVKNTFINKFSDYGYKYIQTPFLEYKDSTIVSMCYEPFSIWSFSNLCL